MARRIRAHDWAATPLGPAERWPQSLRTAVDVVLAMPGPATILWGPASVQLYNDAYIAIAQDRHPALLGRPVAEGWPDAYDDVIAPLLADARAGRATQLAGFRAPLTGADGRLEERVFDTDWSPIRDETGAVAGALQTVIEVTGREQTAAALRESEELRRGAFESGEMGAWTWNTRERVARTDEALQRLWGVSPGYDWHPVAVYADLMHPVGAAALDAVMARDLNAGEQVHDRVEVACGPRAGRWILWRGRTERERPWIIHGVSFDITEQLLAEQRLRESEERLQLAVGAAELAVYEWDLLTDRVTANDRFVEMVGVGPDEPFVGERVLERGVHPDDRERINAELTRAMSGEGAARYAFEHRLALRPDGERWVLSQGQVYFAGADGDGRPARIFGTLLDITNRKRAEAESREAQKRQAFLLKLSDALRTEVDARAVAMTSVTLLADHMGLDRAYVAQVDKARDLAEIGPEYRRADLAPVAGVLTLSDFPKAWSRVEEATLVLTDTAGDPTLSDADKRGFAALRMGALMVASARKGTRNPIWAVLVASEEPRRWRAAEVALIEETAERTWAAIERARAEEALRESERRLRRVIDAETVGVAFFDLRGGINDSNDAFLRMVGFTREEIEAGEVRYEALTPPDLRWRDEQTIAELKEKGEAGPYEKEYFRKDGSKIWILCSASLLDPDTAVEFIVDITGSKRAEAALRASEQQLRDVLDSMSEGFALFDADFTILDVNAETLRLDGRTRDELVGRNHWEAFPGSEDSPQGEMFKRVMRDRIPEAMEHTYSWPDGKTMWVDTRAYPTTHGNIAIQWRDITGRKQVEEKLREGEERQAFILKLSDALRPLAGPVEVQSEAARVLGKHLNAGRATYAEIEADDAHFTVHRDYTDGVPSCAGRYSLAETGDVAMWADLRAGRTVTVADAERDPRLGEVERATYAASMIRAAIAVPLVKGGRLAVVFSLHFPVPHEWTAEQVALVEETAERIWAAVERARAEQALRESEERFRLIVENARDYAIFTLDTDGRITDWFPGAEQVFGWSQDEAQGQPIDVTFTAEDRAAGAPSEEQEIARHDGAAPDIRWHVRKDGSRVFIDGVTSVIRADDGTPRGYLKIGQDVTERRAAEQALRESEERFRRFGEASSDVIWVRNAETCDFEYVSPAFETIYGRSREEAGRELDRWAGFLHPDDRERVIANLDRVRAGERVDHEFRIVRPDGEVRWIDDMDFPLYDDAGRITRIGGFGRDVTLGKQAADALRESEERFRSFAEASEDVLWIVDAATRQLEYVSPAFERIWGEPREAIMADLGEWAARIHPDDLPPPGEGIEALFAGRSYTAEYRVQRRDGTIRYIRDTGFPIFDGDGRVRRVAGLAQDLTEWRNAERAVIESERRARTLMEGIPQLVWRSGDEGRWTWSSPQWQDFTGQSQEESRGLGWLDAVHPDDRETTMRAWEAARPHGMLDAEYRVRRASDGAYLWHHTRSVPVRDEGRRIVEWLGTTTDVQQLKEFQECQEVMVAELQHRTRNLIAVVRSIAQQTMALTGPTPAFQEQFNDRLEALARVQGLLSRSDEEPITIEALIRMELEALGAFREAGNRIALAGPAAPIRHSVVQTLALALHELATNARKHGALSGDEGRLGVTWRVREADGEGRRLTLEWAETGTEVPIDTQPERRGYGRELIERALPYALGARTSYELRPEGVRCTIDMPLEKKERRRRPR